MDLNQITLPTRDAKAAIDFYTRLGLKLIVDSPTNGYARFETPSGDATLSVHETPEPFVNPTTIYFEVEDVDRIYGNLKEKGFRFDLMPTDQKWGWREARLRDPDGTVICIFHGGENRKNPPWRVKD
ncbi:MAG: hypothetical protein Tsb0010_03320 [Parvularculaceae bacterium]